MNSNSFSSKMLLGAAPPPKKPKKIISGVTHNPYEVVQMSAPHQEAYQDGERIAIIPSELRMFLRTVKELVRESI
jgi:hypothetical protein